MRKFEKINKIYGLSIAIESPYKECNNLIFPEILLRINSLLKKKESYYVRSS